MKKNRIIKIGIQEDRYVSDREFEDLFKSHKGSIILKLMSNERILVLVPDEITNDFRGCSFYDAIKLIKGMAYDTIESAKRVIEKAKELLEAIRELESLEHYLIDVEEE